MSMIQNYFKKKCDPDKHNLKEQVYMGLEVAKNSVESTVGYRGVITRMECTKCDHAEEYGDLTDKKPVKSVKLNAEEYDIFADKVLVLPEKNNAIIEDL